MKNKIIQILATLAILAVLILPVVPVFAESGVTIGTSNIDRNLGYDFQRKTFYANGRYWVFYTTGSGVYRTSLDGTAWSGETQWRAAIDYGYKCGFWFDGVNVSYVYSTSTVGNPMYYRRGVPEADGTITWAAAEQTVLQVAGEYYTVPSIIVDSNGFPWISYSHAGNLPKIIKSSTNDGTWTTEAGFPHQLDANADSSWKSAAVPLTDGKILAIYWWGSAIYRLRVKSWTGAAWNAEDIIAATPASSIMQAAAVGDDVHIVFQENGTFDLKHVVYNYATNNLGAENTVYDLAATAHIMMAKTDDNRLYLFWGDTPTVDHIQYLKYNGTWDAAPTDWLDESGDTIAGSDFRFQSFYSESSTNEIGIAYSTKAGAPYNVKFAQLSSIIPPTVTTSAATGVQPGQYTLNGNLSDMGGDSSCDVWFQYGPTPSYGYSTAHVAQGAPGAFEATQYEIHDKATVYFRACASNAAGTSYGSQMTLQTISYIERYSGVLPLATTIPVIVLVGFIAAGLIVFLRDRSPVNAGIGMMLFAFGVVCFSILILAMEIVLGS